MIDTPRCPHCGEPTERAAHSTFWCDDCQQVVIRRLSPAHIEQPDPRRTGPAANERQRPPRGDGRPL